MPETHGESPRSAEGVSGPNDGRLGPPLTPNIRRHLGGALRAAYAARPADPPGERIAGLLNRLDDTTPDRAAD